MNEVAEEVREKMMEVLNLLKSIVDEYSTSIDICFS